MSKEWWLVFDNNKFNSFDDNVWVPLNVKVRFDNYSGNQAETVITFDTGSNGGNDIKVEADPEILDALENKLTQPSVNETGCVTITLRGSLEADAFFDALRNLLKSYDMRQKLA